MEWCKPQWHVWKISLSINTWPLRSCVYTVSRVNCSMNFTGKADRSVIGLLDLCLWLKKCWSVYVKCEGQPGEPTLDACHHYRTGKRKLRLLCGNDGIEDLPHTHKTITVSLHGYWWFRLLLKFCFILWKSFKVLSVWIFIFSEHQEEYNPNPPPASTVSQLRIFATICQFHDINHLNFCSF